MGVLLTGCAAPALPPEAAAAPQPLAQPALSAADIHKAEQHAYWSGFAAGRRYQKQQDAQTADAAPSATPPAVGPPATPPASAPVQPLPPPPDSYSAKGPALPVAAPLN